MEVIGHEAVREHAHVHSGASTAQQSHKGGVVGLVVKDLGAPVAPAEDVVALAAEQGSQRAGHGPMALSQMRRSDKQTRRRIRVVPLFPIRRLGKKAYQFACLRVIVR